MAPLAPENTSRLIVDYLIGTLRHHAVFRFGAGVTSTDAITAARAIITLLKPLITTNSSFNGARWAAAGSVISLPVTWGAAILGTSVEPFASHENAQFLSFVGRSSDGRRYKLTFFGYPYVPNGQYRVAAASDANVLAVVNGLNGNNPPLVTISGSVPVWNTYANVGLNAYWQRKLRRV